MIDELGGFDLSFPLEADYDLTLRAYLNNYKFKQIKYPIAYFSLQGATGKRTDFIDKEHYQILKKNTPGTINIILKGKKIFFKSWRAETKYIFA